MAEKHLKSLYIKKIDKTNPTTLILHGISFGKSEFSLIFFSWKMYLSQPSPIQFVEDKKIFNPHSLIFNLLHQW